MKSMKLELKIHKPLSTKCETNKRTAMNIIYDVTDVF